MNTLMAKELVKTFPVKGGRMTAVDRVSFNIKKGEIFGLLGVNGAGKSTTINILSGLIIPDSGEVEIFNKNFFKNQEEIKSKFNLATAYYTLSTNLTVRQNLKVYAKLYGVKNAEEKIEALTKKFMVNQLFDIQVRALSSGEKTKVVLVKALLNDPKLLFLDECTVGLDPDMAEVTRELLEEYNRETGCSILFTSHYMQEVERLCDRIAFMDRGRIVKIGQASSLIKELEMQEVKLHFSRDLKQAQRILKREGIEFKQESAQALSFQIKNRKNTIYPLLEKFVKARVVFDDLHLNKPTLEEYFIKRSRRKE
ncbi:MAG TPA: ABC transporter ATP-binding protein [Candidatus Nanoarchaeia archaeon]|nr:ABC transporter ATP-binding protein [Candidatus Nanoarchaeia archaeon]